MSKIYIIREQKVMLDEDLAELYGVETKRLNEQVRRKIMRIYTRIREMLMAHKRCVCTFPPPITL